MIRTTPTLKKTVFDSRLRAVIVEEIGRRAAGTLNRLPSGQTGE